ncbi:SLAM family member 9 isoform X3 [Pogona vitticeps]|uniref:SLAM family member 9-like isoform X3 n=1 Tax=Pogona vitticeps TaxID=103695 RepID=A0ABM5F5C2_9SAUR
MLLRTPPPQCTEATAREAMGAKLALGPGDVRPLLVLTLASVLAVGLFGQTDPRRALLPDGGMPDLSWCADLLAGQAQSPPRQVNGVLGGSAVLSVNVGPQAKVKEIEWSYRAGSGPALLVALFRDGKLERPDPSDRFKQRIDMFNETLRIKALELNDSGTFGARVKLLPAIVEDHTFNLAVYEPVLTPRIQSQLVSSTPKWCNVTLQCVSPGKGPVNVTWKKGNPIRDLGNTDRYQISPDGRTLRLSLLPSSLNTTYSCTASNPIEHKIVSFDLQRICQSGAESSFSKSGYVVLTFILLVLSLGAAFWCWRINNEKSAETATIPTVQVEESPSDSQYAEILRRSPPEVPRSPGK